MKKSNRIIVTYGIDGLQFHVYMPFSQDIIYIGTSNYSNLKEKQVKIGPYVFNKSIFDFNKPLQRLLISKVGFNNLVNPKLIITKSQKNNSSKTFEQLRSLQVIQQIHFNEIRILKQNVKLNNFQNINLSHLKTLIIQDVSSLQILQYSDFGQQISLTLKQISQSCFSDQIFRSLKKYSKVQQVQIMIYNPSVKKSVEDNTLDFRLASRINVLQMPQLNMNRLNPNSSHYNSIFEKLIRVRSNERKDIIGINMMQMVKFITGKHKIVRFQQLSKYGSFMRSKQGDLITRIVQKKLSTNKGKIFKNELNETNIKMISEEVQMHLQ